MLERFTDDARTVLVHAQRHARRLGHRYIGCEHLLLALVGADQPASAVLRERGLTPGRVEEGIVRRAGTGAGAGLFADLDRAALASIGIDLDAVRARIDGVLRPGRADPGRPGRPPDDPPRPVPLAAGSSIAGATGPGSGASCRCGPWLPHPRVATRPPTSLPGTSRSPPAPRNAWRARCGRRWPSTRPASVSSTSRSACSSRTGGWCLPSSTAGLSAPELRAAILDRYRPAS